MNRSVLDNPVLSPRIPLSSRKSGILGSAKRSSLRFGSGRSVQSTQVVYRSHSHVVETFGVTLPVLVREALTFSERNAAVSVRISREGWAWFVCGRRLLVWQCKYNIEEGRRRPLNSPCRELTLPSSDIAYRAELVSIYTAPGNQVPSCIAVSPEGLIRYWPNIGHEGSSVELNADLQGQECDSLTDVSPVGCILATTTATIVLLQPQVSGGRHGIVCRPLKLPHGWLGGISRLIPSLLFGSLQTSSSMETKLVKVISVKGTIYESEEWTLYILAGHSLQKWVLVPGELERLVHEFDVNPFAVDAFQKTIWENCGGSPGEITVWLLDMQPTQGGVVILMGATNSQISPQFYYALGTIYTDSLNQPARFDRFCPLKNTGFYRESDEVDLLSYKFVLLETTAFVYNHKSVVAVPVANYSDDADNIEFVGANDEILGAAMCWQTPVFFSKDHGMVSITGSDVTRQDLTNMSVSDMATVDPSSTSMLSEQFNLAVTDLELDEMMQNKDGVTQMKAAFLLYLRKNMQACESILNALFPREEEPSMQVGAALDTIVTRVSRDLMNDIPAGDPRWCVGRTDRSLGSSMSLQIINQLEDKQRALDWFVAFLKENKLWDRLTAVTLRDTVTATTLVVREHAEQLVAATTLKNHHSSHGSLIEQCIKHVVQEEPTQGLSHQDLFYREVSRMTELLQAVIHWSEGLVHSDRRPQEVAVALAEANTLLLGVLQEVLQWRKQRAESYKPKNQFLPKICEYLPWTAAPGSEGLRDSLLLQHSLTLKHGARATGDLSLKNNLYDQLVKLADIILDGRKNHMESVHGELGPSKHEALVPQYEMARASILKPFLEDSEYERAAILAEKYLDFGLLIQICELTNNLDRLDKYCDKYSDLNFSEFLFNWYIKEGKPGRLLEQFRSAARPARQRQALSLFLANHPSLSWLLDIFNNDYKQASNTLHTLSAQETDLLGRRKTMLSLAKLSLLASDENIHVVESSLNEINSELELVAHQEDLPQTVLAAYGYDTDKQRVLSPSELIKLYICEDNQNVTEVDFKKALDLLDYVEDELERNELRHSIWCNAILRDSWKDIDPDASVENILNLFFFKLVDFVEFWGGAVDDFLPPIGQILEAEELGELRNDRQFQYLIRVGYEHFQKTSNCPD